MLVTPFSQQLIDFLASLLLLSAFAMLSQRRLTVLINLYAWQGLILVLSIGSVAYATHRDELYYSMLFTFILKVVLLPIILHRLTRRLNVERDVETLLNIPIIMLLGIIVVIFAFNWALPISGMGGVITHRTLGIALATLLLTFLIIITRRKAIPQVIGFLAMENSLLFAATSATYGMPFMIELGIGLDVLVGTLMFGVFFFHIRETFDSLEIRNLENLKED